MKKEKIVVVLITIMFFVFNIFISYYFNKDEIDKYDMKELNLLTYQNEKSNSYKLSEKLKININDNNILIPKQKILENIDDNIIGFRYSLDGLNYTSTIKLDDTYEFKYVKDIKDISSIYVKVIENNYNEVLTCKYVTDSYEYNPYVEIQVSTKEYTNDGVNVAIKGTDILDNNYEIRYKINNNEFMKYEESFKIEQNNTKIMAVIYNKKENKIEKETEYIITNVDKIAPTMPKDLEIFTRDNMLYIKAINCKDDESGLFAFKYKVNDSDTSDFIRKDDYYIYEIKDETDFLIKVRAIDNVLNESDTYEVQYNLDLNLIKN